MVGAMRTRLALAAVALVWLAAGAAWAAFLAPADARPILVAEPERVVLAGVGSRSSLSVPTPPTVTAPRPTTMQAPAPALRKAPRESMSPCEAARARSRVPLAAGWSESCAARPGDPAAGRAWHPTRTLHYAAAWIDANVRADRAAAWDWLVAHERCHALQHGSPLFEDEPAANACATAAGAPRPASQPAYH